MRILRVAQNVYPEQKGGACYVHAMSRDQAAMGHEVVGNDMFPVVTEYPLIRADRFGSAHGRPSACQ
ncbi:MAG: hypothetical protein ABEH88_08600 [Halobacteriales archaeon]